MQYIINTDKDITGSTNVKVRRIYSSAKQQTVRGRTLRGMECSGCDDRLPDMVEDMQKDNRHDEDSLAVHGKRSRRKPWIFLEESRKIMRR